MTTSDATSPVALVTGASRGLGRAVATSLRAEGYRLVISARDEAALRALADELGDDVHPVAAHAGRWDEADRLLQETLQRFGRVDLLVNNAGSSPGYPSLGEISERLFDSVVSLNLKGPFRLSTLVGEHMVEQGGGTIVNVSSLSSEHPDPAALPYSMAKAAMNAMTVGLSLALAPTVRVNAILPGPFRSTVSEAWTDQQWAFYEEHTSLGRVGEVDEVADAVLYLASPRASFITGTMLRVDGGWS